MTKTKLSFTHKDGIVDGIYLNAGPSSPLVIIINGHNGFYNYGMFPYLQEKFFDQVISSYSFNFSHGGVIGDADYFEDLEGYERNCMRLEVQDLLSILQNLSAFGHHDKIFLLTHSLGSVPTLFGARQANLLAIPLTGIILVSAVSRLNFWPKEMLQEWASAGVYFKKNNRTMQELPQGFEFLQEVINADQEWNVQKQIAGLNIPIMIIHGDADEAVSLDNGKVLYEQSRHNNPANEFVIIPHATHTYNTKHPFEGASAELIQLTGHCIRWIKKLAV